MTQHRVFSGLILNQIKLTKKPACKDSATTTEDHVFFFLGNNVSRILKLCLDLNQRKHYKNYSKWLQKHFKDNGTSGWDETSEFLNIRSQGRNTSLAKWEGGVRPLERVASWAPCHSVGYAAFRPQPEPQLPPFLTQHFPLDKFHSGNDLQLSNPNFLFSTAQHLCHQLK